MMNRKNENRRGFTLVELVVVITIIGILACILVPSLINYIHKAQRKADIVTARHIGNQVMMLMAEDEKFVESFYSKNGICEYNYVCINGEKYKFRSLARCDGAKNCKDTQTSINNHVYYSGTAWEWTAKSYEYVQQRLNENKSLFKGGDKGYFIPMRSRYYHCPVSDSNQLNYGDKADKTEKAGYCHTDRWVVGYRVDPTAKNGAGQPEVWAGNSRGKGANGPRVRLWPNPPSYY